MCHEGETALTRWFRHSIAVTLVEMLVVCAIIGILAGLLLAVVVPARREARKCACVSNLRQIGMGLEMYASDCGGWTIPGDIRPSGDGAWIRRSYWAPDSVEGWDEDIRTIGLGKLYPAYLGDISVLFCSAFDDRGEQMTNWRTGYPWVMCSYVYRGTKGDASSIHSKNSDKAVVMQFMRKDRTNGDVIGHGGNTIPVLWGDGSVKVLDCQLEDVSFNPAPRVEPFLWADQQRHK